MSRIDQLKEYLQTDGAKFKSFEFIQLASDHFKRLVAIADAARSYVKGDVSTFDLKKALDALELD